jgi:thiamine-monophosphate kinase
MGGDIGGAERLFLSASAFGICEAGGALRRSGARPGDLLAITGPVGTPAAAMVYFDRLAPNDQALEASAREELLDAWRRPQARVREGQALAELGAHACQDISDGLRDTVVQLCSASGVGCRIRSAELPIQPSVRGVAALADLDPVALALGASVDFELACAIAPQNVAAQQERFASLGSELHLVGEFTAEQDLILQTPEGDMAVPGASWDHATDDPVAAMLEASRRS